MPGLTCGSRLIGFKTTGFLYDNKMRKIVHTHAIFFLIFFFFLFPFKILITLARSSSFTSNPLNRYKCLALKLDLSSYCVVEKVSRGGGGAQTEFSQQNLCKFSQRF